jgi:DNA-directed RNA polymerase specialized sigma24 family protein
MQYYYLEMSEAEISAQSAQPLGTIKWRLHAARQRLRSLLHDWQRSGIL